MNQIAYLEYTFIFDPADVYTNLSQFEDALGSFFDDRGIEALFIKTASGQAGKRVLFLQPKQSLFPKEKKIIGKPKSVGEKFRNLDPK